MVGTRRGAECSCYIIVPQGLVGNGPPGQANQNLAFTPQTIGNSTTAQRAWISSIYPNLDNASLTSLQNAYSAEAFGTLQMATDLV
jgi:hypothetical protein